MPQIEIEVDARIAKARLGEAQRAFDKELTRAAHKSVAEVHRFMARYPPPPIGSDYIRTGTLGRSWTTTVHETAGDIRAVIGTNLGYAPFVQDAFRQAWMHQGRWQTTADAARPPTIDRIKGFFEQAVDKVAKKFR